MQTCKTGKCEGAEMSADRENIRSDDRVERLLSDPNKYYEDAKTRARAEVEREFRQDRSVGRQYRSAISGRFVTRRRATN